MLLSHRDSPAIPSPQASLTSVFGMGTGVASLLKTPAKSWKTFEYCILHQIISAQTLREPSIEEPSKAGAIQSNEPIVFARSDDPEAFKRSAD